MKINKTHTQTRGGRDRDNKEMLLNICISGDAARMHCVRHCCRSPVASCHSQLPAQSIKCQKCIAQPTKREREREGETEWRSDWRSESIGCPISRHDWYMACIDMDTVLDFHFVGPSTALSAQCKRTSHRQHPTSIQHPFSIHPTSCVNVSVSQSVNVCISQFQISASAVAASLWSPLDLHNLGPTKTPSSVALPRLVVFPILNSNSQLVCKLLAPSEFWFVWNTFTQIWK